MEDHDHLRAPDTTICHGLVNWCLCFVISFLFLVSPLIAEEATLVDGRHLTGELALDKAGQLQFLSAQDTASYSQDQIESVHFGECRLAPFRIAAAHRVILPGEQYLTGQLLKLDGQHLYFRTAW